jgi:hypothetical protein
MTTVHRYSFACIICKEVEAMVEDTEEDPLTTDIPPHVSFVNDCFCAQGMVMEEVVAMVEDIKENPRPTDIPP